MIFSLAQSGSTAPNRTDSGRLRGARVSKLLRGVLYLGALMAQVAFTGTAVAQDPRLACYDRQYSASHLQAHPAQSVDRIRVALISHEPLADSPGGDFMRLWVSFVSQGQGAEHHEPGVVYAQSLRCNLVKDSYGYPDWVVAGSTLCSIDGDGGVMHILSRSDATLDLRTSGVALAEPDWENNLPPPALTAEGRETVTFRLSRVDASRCEETW